MDMSRLDHLKKFYHLIETLSTAVGGPRSLADCTGKLNWPKRGVYFFTEAGENRGHTGAGPRIVRVGTHALKKDATRSGLTKERSCLLDTDMTASYTAPTGKHWMIWRTSVHTSWL
jgi:hypothetical protein